MYWLPPFNEEEAFADCQRRWNVTPRPVWPTIKYASLPQYWPEGECIVVILLVASATHTDISYTSSELCIVGPVMGKVIMSIANLVDRLICPINVVPQEGKHSHPSLDMLGCLSAQLGISSSGPRRFCTSQ